MSKQRPSISPTRKGKAQRLLAEEKNSLVYWKDRIHRPTFTRNGSRQETRSWAVKLQHHGIRRTISLHTTSQGAATRRALRIFQALHSGGWQEVDTLTENYQGSPGKRADKRTPSTPTHRPLNYWKQRLSFRSYLAQAGLPSPQLSVRIERGGLNDYFPTGTQNSEEALLFAKRLEERIVEVGWEITCQEHRREFTIAIFWSANPVTCTYATMLTLTEPTSSDQSSEPTKHSIRRITLIEPNREIAATLRAWLSSNPSFRVTQVFPDFPSFSGAKNLGSSDFILFNRQSPRNTGLGIEWSQTPHHPVIRAFGYGLYEDSNQIFHSVSGVDRGYYLRRRNPDQILEPLNASTSNPTSRSTVGTTVREYFQSLFTELPQPHPTPQMSLLTRRELEILSHLSAGYLDKEIAQRLRISNWTVRNHLKRIYSKLGINSRTEAVIHYLQK
jgi:DNA-binding NarL/FixJ family response regulator